MKAREQKIARCLREQGWSVGAIAKKTNCSKSTISVWVRDISLTVSQVHHLESNQARARALAANHPNSPKQKWKRIRSEIIVDAIREVPVNLSPSLLKLIGTSLYWAEGSKANRNVVNFSNSDSAMVGLMMRFFREICLVPEEQFRGALHIHPHLDERSARKFWSNVSGIPEAQFHATQLSVSKASKQKKDSLPLGTFRIVVSDTKLQCRIQGWINGMHGWVKSGRLAQPVRATGLHPVGRRFESFTAHVF